LSNFFLNYHLSFGKACFANTSAMKLSKLKIKIQDKKTYFILVKVVSRFINIIAKNKSI